MTFTDTQKEQLSAKLDKSKVKTRPQGGRNVSYIEGWHAIAEANRIFGFDGWHREALEIKPVTQVYKNQKGNSVANYFCKVRVTVGDIIREGCGFGSGVDRDEGQAHESAIKEAETDAMKRALMTFGNPFGLALYDKDQKNVDDPLPDTPPQRNNQQKPSNNTQSKQQKPAELTPEQKKQKALEWAQGFIRSLESMQTLQAVEAEYKKHIGTIDKLQNNYKDIYQTMIDKYEDRREALSMT